MNGLVVLRWLAATEEEKGLEEKCEDTLQSLLEGPEKRTLLLVPAETVGLTQGWENQSTVSGVAGRGVPSEVELLFPVVALWETESSRKERHRSVS